jgi:CheY-like chemotaxis protein
MMRKVIVVDDDLTNVGLTKMLLELDGFTVDACTDLAQATDVMSDDVNAFVVDVNLARGESGLDLLRAIRAGETAVSPDTPVILTSGDHRREDEAMEAGADQFLLKPYPPESLSKEITKLVN